jgi:hypothetical protein
MRYLKLYEKFESNTLSKILNYVENKEKIINILNSLCKEYDFPLSKLDDSMFSYLPYKKLVDIKDPNILKFWIDNNKFVLATYDKEGDKTSSVGNIPSMVLSDYEQIYILHENLKEGDIVYLTTNEDYSTIGYVVIDRGRPYVLNNNSNVDGNYPPNYSHLKEFYEYSWALYGNSDYNEISKLLYNGSDIKTEYKFDDKNYIFTNNLVKVDYNYGISFDMSYIKKSELRRSNIVGNRLDQQRGSLLDPNMIDSKIKKENLSRYFDIISKRLDISDDIKNISNIKNKLLMNKNKLLFMVLTGVAMKLDSLINSYENFLKSSKNDDNTVYITMKDLERDISDYYWDSYKNKYYKYESVSDDAKSLYKYLNNIKIPKNIKNENEVFLIIDEINDKIYNKINSMKFKNIEDMEYLSSYLNMIYEVLYSSRYSKANNLLLYIMRNLMNNKKISDLDSSEIENLKRFNDVLR